MRHAHVIVSMRKLVLVTLLLLQGLDRYSESLSVPQALSTRIPPKARQFQRRSASPNVRCTSLLKSSSSAAADFSDAAGSSPSTSNKASAVPSYRKLLVFVSTTILIWLSEPLLSLVDTTVVGRSHSRKSLMELAALGPATMLIDSGIYITYFLAIATTNITAKSLAKRNYQKLLQKSSHVLGVAVVLGLVVTAAVFGLGQPLLQSWTAGTAHNQGPIVQAALQYSKIRSIVAPLVIMDMVAQSICLACLDTKTPAIAVLVASVVNIVGDVLLVTKCGMGIQGAAIATAMASVSSSLILLFQVKRKTQQWKKQLKQQEAAESVPVVPIDITSEGHDGDNTMSFVEEHNTIDNDEKSVTEEETPGANSTSEIIVKADPVLSDEDTSDEAAQEKATIDSTDLSIGSVNGGAASGINGDIVDVLATEKGIDDIPFVSLPDRKALVKLVKLSGPIFFVIVGKVVCYSAMTLRATDFGVLALASHNVMMRVFFFYTTFGDSLSQAAQSFVPQVMYNEKSSPNTNQKQIKSLLLKLVVLSSYVGIVNSNIAGWILRNCGSYFTKDPAILTMMAKHTKFMVLALLVHPFIMLFEGSLVATRDLTYLVGNYAVTMALLMAQLKFVCTDFAGVWQALFVFQMLRLVQFSTRFFQKTLRKGS